MYKIRAVEETDYPAINQLNNSDENMQLQANDSIIGQDFYKQSLADFNSKWYLVEKSGEIKAFIFFTIDGANGAIEVKKFTINYSDRKKGLHDHLYRKLEQIAVQRKATSLAVEISDRSLDVIDFFERNGWMKENQWYVKYMK